MRAETLAGAMGVAGLLLSAVVALNPASAPANPASTEVRHLFPPPPRSRVLAPGAHSVPAVMALDREIARLGRAPPRLDPLRRAFLDSSNLMQFAMDRLPRAAAGDGASAYYLYLALDQCRSFLRGDAVAANASFDRVLSLADLTDEERLAWQSDLERCRGFFTVADWSALGEALGDDEPGAEIEWASAWFERAAQAGYAPALVEQALRPSPYTALERAGMLRDAMPSAGAEAYWLLFAHSGEVDGGDVGAPALAWLIVACRAGQDCSEDAPWYRAVACMQSVCEPGQTALEHYWQSASLAEREEAWVKAARIEGSLKAGEWDDLPLPDLGVLDSSRLWGLGF